MQACNVDELSAATIRRHTELSSTSETRPAVMDLQHDPAASGGSSGGSSELRATAVLQQQRRYKSLDAAGGAGRGTILDSSAECSSSCHDTLIATLFRIEAWLQRRVLECVWWQVKYQLLVLLHQFFFVSRARVQCLDDKVHGFNSVANLDQASFVCALVGTELLHDAEIGGFVDAGELN